MSLPPGVKIKDTDKGWQNFKKAVDELAELRADVGYWGGATHNDSALPVTLLAVIHEYGVEATEEGPAIPSRPFLRQAADTGAEALYPDALRVARQVIAGKRNGKSFLQLMANKFRQHARRVMDLSPTWAAPLSPKTIARKGNDHPLEDTLELRDMMMMRVRKKGE